MANSLVTTPYQHDVQVNGTPMVPSSSNAHIGVVPVGNYDGTPISGGGGGGGDASAANQTTQITAEQAIQTNTNTLTASGAGAYVRQDSTATIAKETGGNLATVVTNTTTLTASGAGGYVRQDSTATIAKESGGNLATLAGIVSSSKAAVKTADGDQVTFGAKADAAITDSTTTNTHMSFLKGLVKIFADVWDSTNHWLKVLRVKKDTFGTTTAFTITLASLANSTAGVGRQATLVTGNVAESALIAVKFTVGTTPTANTLISVYLIRGDGTLNDDNAGASDAGLTVVNAPLLGNILCSAATSNAAYYGLFDTKFLGSLGPTFGIAIVNSTGVAANATGGNFTAEYTTIT